MCTAINLQSQTMENYFGRTMDFSYSIEPQLFVVPRGYTWNNVLNGKRFYDLHRFIAIGQESHGLLGFFDGVNEKGFAAATLYFAGYATFDSPLDQNASSIAAFDFLHFILGRCGCLDELIELLSEINLVGLEDPVTHTIAPLHWFATDRSGKSVVVEQTEQGLFCYENPIGVMSNSPDFPWHMTNLRNYMEVSPLQRQVSEWGNVTLTPFGQAGGTSLLPGGYTSPERFVRVAYLKTHIEPPQTNSEAVQACFHIMESVSIPKGVVITSRDTTDYTKYVAFINTNTCDYYFKTYDNMQLTTASLQDYRHPDKLMRLGCLARPVTFYPM